MRHLGGDPGLLYGVGGVARGRGKTLNGDDRLTDAAARFLGAGGMGLALDPDRAGAAVIDAAAVLRAGQAELVAQDPEEGSLGVRVNGVVLAVNVQSEPGLPCR